MVGHGFSHIFEKKYFFKSKTKLDSITLSLLLQNLLSSDIRILHCLLDIRVIFRVQRIQNHLSLSHDFLLLAVYRLRTMIPKITNEYGKTELKKFEQL
jgi:predicted DNA-binding transcriptional regulator